MDKDYEIKYHKLEENYWWFVGHRDIILKLIKDYDKNIKILDIGCAGGTLIKDLDDIGFRNIYGIDISEEAIELCKKRGLKGCYVMDASKLKFNDEEFDLIISADVLEHLKDDKLALKEWSRVLKKNGKLIVFAPAFKFLWSDHDEVNYHYRRYSKKELISRFEKTNFRIERSSYWNFTLFFPVAILRIFKNFLLFRKDKKRKDQLYNLNPFFNKILLFLIIMENLYVKKLNFPFGISTFVIAKKF